MRGWFVFASIAGLSSFFLAQPPAAPPATPSAAPAAAPSKIASSPLPSKISVDAKLKDMFDAKIRAEWEALKNRDKKSYAELLDDDYQGVEVDGKGERNKVQSINELVEQNISNYTLWGYKLIPLGADSALAIYESTIQFPATAQIRYSRVYISEIWVKRGEQWKELHYQETRVK